MKDLKKMLELLNCLSEEKDVKNDVGPWKIGEKYQITTVTMIVTGELTYIGDKELVMKDAAWIADTGRLSDSLEDQTKYNEVEPFKEDVIIGRGSIIHATKIYYLERNQK